MIDERERNEIAGRNIMAGVVYAQLAVPLIFVISGLFLPSYEPNKNYWCSTKKYARDD